MEIELFWCDTCEKLSPKDKWYPNAFSASVISCPNYHVYYNKHVLKTRIINVNGLEAILNEIEI